MSAKLYMMLGYPGAGKTTAAEIIANLTGAVHLASDMIRLEMFPRPEFTQEEHAALYKTIDERAEALLVTGRDVIYDANLNRYIHRMEKYGICKRTGTESVLVWVQTERELSKKRATENAENDPKRPYGNLDRGTFDRLADEIEPPVSGENFIKIDGAEISLDYIRDKMNLGN